MAGADHVGCLAGCMNPQCKWNGLCGYFFTATADARELPQAAGALCTNYATCPDASPACSDKKGFTNLANSRETRRAAAADAADTVMHDPKTSYFTNVNPARDPSRADRAEQKRKRTASGIHSEGPPAKRMPPSPVKATAYTFVLVDHTKAAHSNKGCKVPDKNELNVLHSNDLVQLISVPHNATTGDIRQLVSDAFNTLPVLKAAPASMHGFVWLTKVTHGRGARASLFVNKRGGDFKYQDLEWSCEKKHRQAPNYRNIIYIALSSWSPNLNIGLDHAYDKDDNDDDYDYDDDGASSFSNASDDRHSRPSGFRVNRARSPPSDIPDSIIKNVWRLTRNMCEPEEEHPAFPRRKERPMNDVLSALPSLVTILQQVSTDNLWTPLHVMQIAMQPGGLFDHLNVIIGLPDTHGDKEDETDAAALIRFGRFGLHPVIDFLHDAYQLATVSLVLTRQQVATVAEYIDSVAVKMHSHILAFRTSHPRDVYDPTQVSFLCRMLEVHRHKFPAAESSERLTTLANIVGVSTVEDYVRTLEVDFGNFRQASSIRAGSLVLGEHGIDGLLKDWVFPHPRHRASNQLAVRLREFTKAEGKAKARALSPDAGQDDPDVTVRASPDPVANPDAEWARSRPSTGRMPRFEETNQAQRLRYAQQVQTKIDRSVETKIIRRSYVGVESEDVWVGGVDTEVHGACGFSNEVESGVRLGNKSHIPRSSPSVIEVSDNSSYDASDNSSDNSSDESSDESSAESSAESSDESSAESDSSVIECSSPPFTGARREKFPYPEFRSGPERPRPPSPLPPPRPRPRPLLWTPPKIRDPALLTKIKVPRRLVETVLERFPHPNGTRRMLWSAIREMELDPKLRRRILMIYHPDKNGREAAAWQDTCVKITQALTASFSTA
ncbi:hypothetical protein GGX14DRAFT_401645 [Mycena pura]|uniref:Uncharacterized protein n=1 Tax=Mycena pura TaxID=153505 RepID=A0AAD6Y885_9AGAR|nr:hypothetical protein GGX14DRAFT_401645 [Mycena pura]